MTASVQTESMPVSGVPWHIIEVDERQVMLLKQRYDLPEVVARLLVSRGVKADRVEGYLQPTLREDLPDPSCLRDMDKAAERLAQAIMQEESIAVFGDYDVDGATSSAMLIRFLRMLGQEGRVYIPDRIMEGYGPNTEALLKLREEGADVLITVDCGTVSFEPLEKAAEAGLASIVIDHHLATESLPQAVAVVNPNRLDDDSGLGYLAGAGVTFLLVVATVRALRQAGYFAEKQEPNITRLLDLAALGTVCDVMPLTGLNRTLVTQGLKVMGQRRNVGLRSLADVVGVDTPPSVYHAGFIYGPRINAGGRVGNAMLGSRLLSTEDAEEAMQIAQQLDHQNQERKVLETLVLEQAQTQLAGKDNQSVVFVQGEGWHPGVIGIVASRIKEQAGVPTAVLAIEDGLAKASARSITGVDLGAAITEARAEGLLVAGGGHAMAAGFTCEVEKVDALYAFLDKRLAAQVREAQANRMLTVDGVVAPSGITVEFLHQLEQVGPFGVGNPQPRLLLPRCSMVNVRVVGEHHISGFVSESGHTGSRQSRLKAIAFRAVGTEMGEMLQRPGVVMDIVGHARINHWQGLESAEFTIEDVRLACS